MTTKEESGDQSTPMAFVAVDAAAGVLAKSTVQTMKTIEATEVYKMYRSRIEQQSALLAQRVSLVIPLQSALLLAWSWFAFGTANAIDPLQFVRYAIPVLAIAQLAWTYRSALACLTAIGQLVSDFKRLDKTAEHRRYQFTDKAGQPVTMEELFGHPEDPSSGVLFPIVSERKIHAAGHHGGLAIIIVLGVIWLAAFSLLWVPR